MKERTSALSARKVVGRAGRWMSERFKVDQAGFMNLKKASSEQFCEGSPQNPLKDVVSASHPEYLSPKKFLYDCAAPLVDPSVEGGSVESTGDDLISQLPGVQGLLHRLKVPVRQKDAPSVESTPTPLC